MIASGSTTRRATMTDRRVAPTRRGMPRANRASNDVVKYGHCRPTAEGCDVATGDVPLDPGGFPDPGRPHYCARCGTAMTERDSGGRRRPVCPRCGWVYYAKNALGAAVLVEREGMVLLVQRAHP